MTSNPKIKVSLVLIYPDFCCKIKNYRWFFDIVCLQLKSSDDVEFCVGLEIARKSMTIRTMLDDLGLEDGDEEPGLLARAHIYFWLRFLF